MDPHKLFVPHSKSIVQKDRYLDIKVSQKWLDNFLLGVQHCLKSRRGSYLLTDKLLGRIHYAVIKPLIF